LQRLLLFPLTRTAIFLPFTLRLVLLMIPLDKRSLQRLIEYLVRAHPHRLGVIALRLSQMHKRVLLVLVET
jgi:hypothetical protein